MRDTFIRFLLRFAAFTLIIWLFSFAINFFSSTVIVNRWYTFILLFLFLAGVVSSYFVIGSINKKISGFANVYMIQNFVRLVLFTIVIFGYAYFNRGDAASFAITFFIYYFLLTAWEVVALRRIAN